MVLRGGGGSLGKLSAMFAFLLHILSLEYTKTLVCSLPLKGAQVR